MNWNDWEFIWKRQAPPVGAAADVVELAATFEAKRRRMERVLLVRDVSEASAGVLVCAVLVAFWRWMPGLAGWPIALAIALTLGVSAFFCLERVRTHRGRLGPEAPIAARIARQLDELRHMRRLHYNIISWYLAPIGASWALVVFAALRAAAKRAPHGFFTDLMGNPLIAAFLIGYLFIVAPLCFWGAWFINRRAVRKQIDPRIEELEKLQRELTTLP